MSFQENNLIPFDNRSTFNWKGISSQKFLGGRKHFNIGETLDNPFLPSLGKKHFDDRFDKPKAYKASIRLFPNKRNVESDDYNAAPSKLIYVPAQKKFKPFKLKISPFEKTGKSSKLANLGVSKMKWKEKEKLEAIREDQRSVYELNEWEHKIRKLLDPFYVANQNEEIDE